MAPLYYKTSTGLVEKGVSYNQRVREKFCTLKRLLRLETIKNKVALITSSKWKFIVETQIVLLKIVFKPCSLF